MLVDINLLPQKEAKNKALFMLALISIIILLLGGLFAYWLNRSYEQKLANYNSQIATTEQLVASEQEKIFQYQSSNSYTELEQTVQWAKDYPIKTVPIIKKLTALLPERGFIQTINYEETGNIVLGIQFESTRDAAYYLNHLLDSTWLTDAKINRIDTVTSFYDKKFGDETIDESKLKNEKYVPRYIGEFELTLNKDVIKVESEPRSSVEGGNGS